MKTILPWLLAVLALGGALLLYNSNQSKSARLAKLETEVQELETLRTEIAVLKREQVSADEVAQLRKDKEDVLRLRAEVSRLRTDKQQLAREAQTAQASAQRAQADTLRIQEQARALAQAQTVAATQAQAQQVQLVNACINNLRQIDGAKQQWALENNKTADAVPSAPDIAPYIKGGVIPACPAAGRYTLNAVAALPACSVAGHVLPQQ